VIKEINRDDLDSTSKTIIKNLAKHLEEEELQVKDLFKDDIFMKVMKAGNEKKGFEVIKSQDFFIKLREIYALPYDKETKPLDIHKDLELILSNKNCSDIIFVNKIQEAINLVLVDKESNVVKEMVEEVAVVNKDSSKDNNYKDDFASEQNDSADEGNSPIQ